MSPRALLEASGYLLPRTRLRRAPTTPAANAAPGTDAAAATAAPAIPLEPPRDPVERASEVRVAVVIAMPNPHLTAYVPPGLDAETHRAESFLGMGKGKAREM